MQTQWRARYAFDKPHERFPFRHRSQASIIPQFQTGICSSDILSCKPPVEGRFVCVSHRC